MLICSVFMMHAADRHVSVAKKRDIAERDARVAQHVASLKATTTMSSSSTFTRYDRQCLLVDFVNEGNAFDALDLDKQRAILNERYKRINVNLREKKNRPVRTEPIEVSPFPLLFDDNDSTPNRDLEKQIQRPMVPRVTTLHEIRVAIAKEVRKMLAQRAKEQAKKPFWKHY